MNYSLENRNYNDVVGKITNTRMVGGYPETIKANLTVLGAAAFCKAADDWNDCSEIMDLLADYFEIDTEIYQTYDDIAVRIDEIADLNIYDPAAALIQVDFDKFLQTGAIPAEDYDVFYYQKPIGAVVEKIQTLRKYGVHFIEYEDDVYNLMEAIGLPTGGRWAKEGDWKAFCALTQVESY